jgi:hypothetical protein
MEPRIPDGSLLAVSCNNSHCVQLWDLRQIRAQLVEMKLDWNLPPYRSAEETESRLPMRVEIVGDVSQSSQ